MNTIKNTEKVLYGGAGGLLVATIIVATYGTEARSVVMLLNSITFVVLGIALVGNTLVAYKQKSWKTFIWGVGIILVLSLITKFSFFLGDSVQR
jgi:hypothetical protein